MIAGHVGVPVEPDAVDAVVVGAVGREEVKNHAVAELGKEGPGLLAGVNDVVIDDEVASSSWR